MNYSVLQQWYNRLDIADAFQDKLIRGNSPQWLIDAIDYAWSLIKRLIERLFANHLANRKSGYSAWIYG